ncbi:MAG: hypothetical protein JWM95_213 [Gemmatimonadetes bacterium]|nr:hypothetical protein [Gemmatimonadota bacterium]
MMFMAACHDFTPTKPLAPVLDVKQLAAARCQVSVVDRVMSCTAVKPLAARSSSGGVHFDRIVGGQDVYIKLASAGTTYDAGTEVLSSSVSMQNLTQFLMGTTDGSSVTPINVFFDQQPTTTSGSGTVTVANADGTATFTASGQPYFQYGQIVAPYEISSSKLWQFNLPASVVSFEFSVYVSAPMTNETFMLLDRVWTGSSSTDWLADANWAGAAAPVATSTVGIPSDSLLAPGHAQPSISADTAVANLRVGYGSTLSLNAHTLKASGNVDAVGTITGGTLRLTGPAARIGGNVDAVNVTGSARLQRNMHASAAVSVTGTLTVTDYPLTIQIP